MPIINMAHSSREDAESRGVNVRPYITQVTKRDPVTGNYLEGQYEDMTIWLYDTHVGLCLSDRERNGYDDSDFLMTVWDEETQQTKEIEYASTRGWSYPCYGSRPDATPEVCEKANAYRRRLAVEGAIAVDRAKARIPEAGRLVRVVKGRKAPLGLYLVHHTTPDQYRSKGSAMARAWGFVSNSLRCALHPTNADGSVNRAAALAWTADINCEVVNPEQYETDVSEITARYENERWYFPKSQERAA
jgi:hypothetical protein